VSGVGRESKGLMMDGTIESLQKCRIRFSGFSFFLLLVLRASFVVRRLLFSIILYPPWSRGIRI
jgi:hypothetical protein